MARDLMFGLTDAKYRLTTNIDVVVYNCNTEEKPLRHGKPNFLFILTDRRNVSLSR